MSRSEMLEDEIKVARESIEQLRRKPARRLVEEAEEASYVSGTFDDDHVFEQLARSWKFEEAEIPFNRILTCRRLLASSRLDRQESW